MLGTHPAVEVADLPGPVAGNALQIVASWPNSPAFHKFQGCHGAIFLRASRIISSPHPSLVAISFAVSWGFSLCTCQIR